MRILEKKGKEVNAFLFVIVLKKKNSLLGYFDKKSGALPIS